MIKPYTLWLAALFILLIACRREPETMFTLLDPADTGITFANSITETSELNILRYEYMYNGGGVAAGDLNNDGLVDLVFTANTGAGKMYLNRGNWRFEDITARAGFVSKARWKTGVAMVDINADGLLDVYVCSSGPGTIQQRCNALYLNHGGDIPTFTDVANAYGLDACGTFSTQASFFDYDQDGDPDMFLLNHARITYNPFFNTRKLRSLRHPFYGNRLYRNDGGKFTDVSEAAGIHGSAVNFGLGVSVSDVNQDHWPDLYVTNDYEEQDFFYLNNRDGTFTECLKESFRHIPRFGMGSDIADYNNDGHYDVFVVDMLPEDAYRQRLLKGADEYDKYMLLRDSGYHHQNMRNMLQLNLGNNARGIPQFSEIGQLANVSATDWSWCPLFVDLDNDGWKDLFVTNGFLRDYTNMDFLKYAFEDQKKKFSSARGLDTIALIRSIPSTKLSNYCFRNNTRLQFENVSAPWGFHDKSISHGAVYADLDNDGDQDMAVNHLNDVAHIYRNNSREKIKNHFMKIRLQGTPPNTFAIGAKVSVITDSMQQVQEHYTTRGYQSSVAPELIFGLGKERKIKALVVQWPDKKITRITNPPIDTLLVLRQSSARETLVPAPGATPLFTDVSHLIGKAGYKHIENNFVDYKVQYLLPYQLSANGPCIATGDVNKDGYDDFYAGGASGQPGVLFLSQEDGFFKRARAEAFESDRLYEDTGAAFLDVDRDGDLDLYVVSGGSEFSLQQAHLLQDRLYINDQGNFRRVLNALPVESANNSCIAEADYDRDGDLDLFVGGRSLPGNFPVPAHSFLLRNDSEAGRIRFTDITPGALRSAGMINTATWLDYNGDGWEDLVIAGDFTAVLVFENKDGSLTSWQELVPDSNGMWSKLVADDVDEDGDKDIIAGNAGTNLQFAASVDQPLTIHYADFNADGKIDPLLCYFIQGKQTLYASRDELVEQLPHLKKKFVKYADYAAAAIEDVVPPEQWKRARVLKATTLSSSIIYNNGNRGFQLTPLAIEAQFSKVNGIVVDDFNGDGIKDILLSGNFFPYRVQLGRNDAGTGLLLTGNNNGTYRSMMYRHTGFDASGDVRAMQMLQLKNGKHILLGINNDFFKLYKVSTNERIQFN